MCTDEQDGAGAAGDTREARHRLSVLVDGLGLNGLDAAEWNISGCWIVNVVAPVTPEMATEWLHDRNLSLDDDADHGNRTASRARIERYAEQMRSGLWRVSPQNVIAYDEEGFLLDGQHRLMAITRQTGAIEFLIQAGWPRSSFAVIDQVCVRRGSQLVPGKHRTLRSAAARILIGRTGMAPANDGFAARSLNPEIDIKWMSLWPEVDELASDVATVYSATRINAPSHLAVLSMAKRTKHAHRIDEWVASLADGAGLDPTDPRLHLRNRFIRDYRKLSGAGSGRTEAYSLIVKMWNAYVLGQKVRMLKVNSSEVIPDVIGFDRAERSVGWAPR